MTSRVSGVSDLGIIARSAGPLVESRRCKEERRALLSTLLIVARGVAFFIVVVVAASVVHGAVAITRKWRFPGTSFRQSRYLSSRRSPGCCRCFFVFSTSSRSSRSPRTPAVDFHLKYYRWRWNRGGYSTPPHLYANVAFTTDKEYFIIVIPTDV